MKAIVHREEGSLWAEVPDLPGCFASGADMAELRLNLDEAIAIYQADATAPPAGDVA